MNRWTKIPSKRFGKFSVKISRCHLKTHFPFLIRYKYDLVTCGNMLTYMNGSISDLSVSLYSDNNFLSLSILENLLSKNCYVNVITNDVKNWLAKTSHLTPGKRFSVLSDKTQTITNSLYTVIVLGFNNEDPYKELSQILKKYPSAITKTLILMPFEKYSFTESSLFNFSSNLGVIYLGDLLGPRIDLSYDLLITKTIGDIYFKRKLNLAVGELFYPTFVSDAAKTICRWVFSFGPYGKETFLYGSQVSASTFWKENAGLVGEIRLAYDTELKPRFIPKGVETKQLFVNLKFLLTETYKWLKQVSPQKHSGAVRKKRQYPKFLKPLVFGAMTILLFPVLIILFTLGTFFLSYKQFLSGNDAAAQNTVLIGKTFSVIAKEESRGLNYVPLLGYVYKEINFIAVVGERFSDMAVVGIPLIRNFSELADNILGSSVYDPTSLSLSVRNNLSLLYDDISLFQTDVNNAVSDGSFVAGSLAKRVNIDKFKNLTLQMENLSQNLPSLLGKDKSKTYLVLFQNNMELRPTGGFIGSFGILTFDGGRVSDLTINDVYSADGQLNGHVEPPTPIKKYLNEANWWLRDSNWDPDFPTSAKRAEWFLDKEVGRQVDGVLATDLQPIKDILKYTGPIFLPDFNMDITSDNLYEKTQAEVQDNFFPGTHKKASFLTALSRSLLAEMSKLGTTGKIGVLKSFYSDLEGRSIQMFFHDDNSQNPISVVGWDGGVNLPDCDKGCYPDMMGLVEANVGVNKSNYFIERSENLQVNLTPNGIDRKLTLTLKNSANSVLGVSGTYKVYVRLISNSDSTASPVKVYTGQASQEFLSDMTTLKNRNETGVYVEILGGQTKTLEFTWSTTIANAGSFNKYGLYIRKQGGVPASPVSLTVKGKSVYNGLLAGDYFSRLNW